MNGDLVEQEKNLVFGGGVCTSLTDIELDSQWENLSDKFADSLIKTCPNIKVITFCSSLN
jgi:hypothetical protein